MLKSMAFPRWLLFIILMLSSCDAIATVGTDHMQTFGSGTSIPITALQTPASGNQIVVAAIFGISSPAPSPPAGFTQRCTDFAGGSWWIWTHTVSGTENPAYGNLTFASSGGAVFIGERSGMNSTTPIDTNGTCVHISPVGSNLTPTLALGGTTYQNELPESLFETNQLGRCTGGAGTCNQAGWTERGYGNTGVFGEEQVDNSVSPRAGVSTLMNLNNTSANTMRVLGWYDEPATLTSWCLAGAMLMGMIGC
jgi:hypothetical protein